MPRLPALKAQQVIAALEKIGFQATRQKGSHLRMRHEDGRVVTVPVHSGKVLGRGLLRKILRDIDLTPEEFINLL